MEPKPFHCGIVALLGRPNVGKSTLLNHLLGEKMAPVSPKAQTTRRALRGIWNEEGYQIIFVDTPGLHLPPQGKKLNEFCVSEALRALEDADAFIYILDGSRRFEPAKPGSDEAFILEALGRILKKRPVPLYVAINKADLFGTAEANFASQSELQEGLKNLPVAAMFPISAKHGDGVQALLAEIKGIMPVGPALYDQDQITDQSMRALVAELIQEQLFYHLGEEVPYSCTVEIDRYEEPHGNKKFIEIDANIHVERAGQKAMVIGKGGQKIKEIGQGARASIEKLAQGKVVLKLYVKHSPDWSRDIEQMKRLGYVVQKN